VTITLDRGPSFSTTLKELRHIEYGYATTSHSSQGMTIDRVLVNIDTEQSVALVNQQQFYVSMSRARQDVRIFTNKQDELAQAVSRSWPKATALDAVTQSQAALQYVKPRDTKRTSGTTRQPDGQQQRETFRERQLPASTPRNLELSQVGHQGQQVDTALLVSHRQSEWRRERRRTRPEQMVVRSLTERQGEQPAQSLRHEETSEQKLDRSRGIRYSR
jgi:hypothetical protein